MNAMESMLATAVRMHALHEPQCARSLRGEKTLHD